MNLQNLRIGTRMWLAVGVSAAVLALLLAFATARGTRAQAFADAELSLADSKIRLATQWAMLTEATVARVRVNAINSDPAVEMTMNAANKVAIARIAELQKQIQALGGGEAEKALMEKIAVARKAVFEAAAKVDKLKEAGDLGGAVAESKNFTAATVPYMQALTDFVKLQEQGEADVRTQVAAQRHTTTLITLGVVGLLLLGMVGGTWWMVTSIQKPLGQAMQLAESIAAGDLSQTHEVARGDEMGDLMRSLLAMSRSLSSTVGQVRTSADSIQTASSEIAAGNTDLSQRTEQTASSLQQTASSMEQLTGTVRQSADAASQANQLASSATQIAQRGGSVVSQVVATMEEINSSSKKIADIIGTIDGIAFQTNILALNAAVEAARAGEQGRGFAVVAGEVRLLAQRSAEAAREIKSLIGASVEKVESGSRLVADAGSTMTEIVASVQRVTDILGEISAAASEQSTGIGQVNGAVSQLDQMTQQNAALVEESAAAAGSLKQQAVGLASLVATFRLDAQGAAPQAAPMPAPRPAAAKAHSTGSAAPPKAARTGGTNGTNGTNSAAGTATASGAGGKTAHTPPASPAPRASRPAAAATPLIATAAAPTPVAAGAESDWESF